MSMSLSTGEPSGFCRNPRSRRGVVSLASSGLLRLALLSGCCALFVAPGATVQAAEASINRILVEYVPPTNPQHQTLYQMLKERRALEKLQEVFSPFRLPTDLTLRSIGCDGVSNAWYHRPDVSVCYEYLEEIRQSMPKETTAAGVTPADAVMGQFFYVYAHEMGHAMFDVLKVPIFGDAENAADHFAGYLMLQFGKEQARGLIMGAAYSYKKYLQSSEVTAPLVAFSDVHAAPAQRFYNLICLAYGADPVLFAEAVDKDYLPKARARGCKDEYEQVAFAFRDVIHPHIDEQLAKKVLDKTWLPEMKGR
jgi:Putative metallopeptidase